MLKAICPVMGVPCTRCARGGTLRLPGNSVARGAKRRSQCFDHGEDLFEKTPDPAPCPNILCTGFVFTKFRSSYEGTLVRTARPTAHPWTPTLLGTYPKVPS